MHSATKGLDWELEVRALARRIYSQVGVMRKGSESFKYRLSNPSRTVSGSSPVLTTKKKRLKIVGKRLGSYHYIPYL